MKKRNVLIIALVALIGIAFIFNACKKDEDTTKPVITLKKDATNSIDMIVVFNSTFTDPGYSATDDVDGDISSSVTVTGGPVNNLSAGVFNLVHNVKDAAGNAADAVTRKVTVDAAAFLVGAYTVNDYDGVSYHSTYPENITASTTEKNKIYFGKFGNYSNALVYGTIAGTTITIPSQTILCGTNPIVNHTFAGSGTFTTSNKININYSDSSSEGNFPNCTGEYTKL